MHGMNDVKVINALQARTVYHYKNSKEKSFKTNAVVWANKSVDSKQMYVCLL